MLVFADGGSQALVTFSAFLNGHYTPADLTGDVTVTYSAPTGTRRAFDWRSCVSTSLSISLSLSHSHTLSPLVQGALYSGCAVFLPQSKDMHTSKANPRSKTICERRIGT